MPNSKLYVRCWVPGYATAGMKIGREYGIGIDGEYTPWVVGHNNPHALQDEALVNARASFCKEVGHPFGEMLGDTELFYTYLGRHGYTLFTMTEPIFVVV